MKKNYEKIPLFWWSEIQLMHKEKENYGDLISKYLVEKISGKEVKWVQPKKQSWFKRNKRNYLAAGSIIHHATKDSIVWGSGIIEKGQEVAAADFRAVRGPETRKHLLSLGYQCPEVYGDPALLMPEFYNPKLEKKFKTGIIPHYNDYQQVQEWYKDEKNIQVIDLMTLDVEDVTRRILECEKTISSSLHGLIVSQAYGIPGIWVEFSNRIYGDGIKYTDYFQSVDLNLYRIPVIEKKQSLEEVDAWFKDYPVLPKTTKIESLCAGLLNASPF